MDLAQELERAVPSGPPLPPPETRVAMGRGALRRRRAVVAVAVAGAAASVVVPMAFLWGTTASRGVDPVPPVATRPTTVEPTPDAESAPRRERDPAEDYDWRAGEVTAIELLGGNGLLIRPGAVVLERRDDLFPGKDTESVALRLRFEGREYWAMWEWDDAGGAVGSTGGPRNPFYTDFEDFVAKSTVGGGMTSGPSRTPGPDQDLGADPVPAELPWLSVDVADGRMQAVSPGRLVDQRVDVDLPGFAPPGTTTAAALVEARGTRYLALFRGEEELVVVEATGHGETLEELLAWARERYRSGAGLL